MLLNILLFLLVIISISFSFLLFKKLVPWSYQYRKYLESIKNSNKNYNLNNRGRVHPLVDGRALKFKAISIKSKGEVTLESIIQEDLVLIFMNASCIYCDNNLELFINESHKYPSFKYVVVMSEIETKEAETLANLFEKEVDVLIVKEQVFFDYQIKFWPSFVHINKSYRIQNVTPIPTFVFQGIKTA